MKSTTCTIIRNIALIVATLLLTAGATWAGYAVPPDLADLVNQDLDFGRRQMSRRGYEMIYSSPSGGLTQYWWNRAGRSCVYLEVHGRKIGDLKSVDQMVCRQQLKGMHQPGSGYPGSGGQGRHFRLEEKETAYCVLTSVALRKEAFNGLCSVTKTFTRRRTEIAVKMGFLPPVVFTTDRGGNYLLVHSNGSLVPVSFRDFGRKGVFSWNDYVLEVAEFQ